MHKELKFEATPEQGMVSGQLYLPKNATALLLLAHGAGTDMRHYFMEDLCLALEKKDVATFRFNFPYKEKGKRGGPNSPKILIATIRSAVKEVNRISPNLPIFAGGKSMGGRMTSLAESDSALGVDGLIFFGFPLHPAGKASTERAAHLKAVDVPMLFLSGPRDTLAKSELLIPMVKDLGRKATIHMVEGADHSFKVLKRSERNEAEVIEELAQVCAAWLTKHSLP